MKFATLSLIDSLLEVREYETRKEYEAALEKYKRYRDDEDPRVEDWRANKNLAWDEWKQAEAALEDFRNHEFQ